jgi:pilus assembly protein FimV
MALTAPGAANALGLGDIHIDSKLNQPLSAHIDILGATDQELASLRAAVASRELFQEFGSDRPGFLSSAQFQVTRDRQRRPILSVHSSEPFTEPLVSFLIDLRWPNGNLVREYTLLLDAATPSDKSEFTAVTIAVPESTIIAAPAPSMRRVSAKARAAAKAPPSASPSISSEEPPAPHTVRANETLHGIARMAGAQSAADVRQMMIALFRANPEAFDANINRLHRGAVLVMPSAEQLAVISRSEANREFRAHMSAWRLAGRPVGSTVVAAESPAAAEPPAVPQPETVVAGEDLNQRIESLERSLREVKSSIERDDAKLRDLQSRAETAQAVTAVPAAPLTAQRSLPPAKRFVQGAGILGSALGLFWLLRLRRRPDAAKPSPALNAQEPDELEPQPAVSVEPVAAALATAPPVVAVAPVPDSADAETVILESASETTMYVAMDPTVELKRDENLVDLERTAQHVFMPSDLNDQSIPFVERRTNVVDVLRAAINREPHRRELKMKLLELYYATAAANQNSFLEVAKMLARDRDVLATGDWDRVVAMGRTISPGEKLFLLDPDAGEISDVADSAA